MSYSRADRKGAHRANYERNRKRIMATQNTCGICGHPVDFSLKTPHPMSATADHIIPVAKNGHPSDIDNLQLAHWTCNRQKSDKIFKEEHKTKQVIGNRNLPQSLDWINYNSNKEIRNENKTKRNQVRNNINKRNNKIKIIKKKTNKETKENKNNKNNKTNESIKSNENKSKKTIVKIKRKKER